MMQVNSYRNMNNDVIKMRKDVSDFGAKFYGINREYGKKNVLLSRIVLSWS